MVLAKVEKMNNAKFEFLKKSQEIVNKIDILPDDLYNYADEQSEHLNDEMFYQAKELSENIKQFKKELKSLMLSIV